MQRKIMGMAVLAALGLGSTNAMAAGNIQITEWMYNGLGGAQGGGEFIEFTNIGNMPVNLNGWSFDDDSRTAGTVSLTAFGMINPLESFILAEASAANFRTVWNLSASIKIIGSNSTNLGRGDEINLYDDQNQLVDRLTYGDNALPGTIRTQNISGNPASLAALTGQTVTASGWVLSQTGDIYGSYASSTGNIGNPGAFTLAVPEPESAAMLLAGLGLMGLIMRRREHHHAA